MGTSMEHLQVQKAEPRGLRQGLIELQPVALKGPEAPPSRSPGRSSGGSKGSRSRSPSPKQICRDFQRGKCTKGELRADSCTKGSQAPQRVPPKKGINVDFYIMTNRNPPVESPILQQLQRRQQRQRMRSLGLRRLQGVGRGAVGVHPARISQQHAVSLIQKPP